MVLVTNQQFYSINTNTLRRSLGNHLCGLCNEVKRVKSISEHECWTGGIMREGGRQAGRDTHLQKRGLWLRAVHCSGSLGRGRVAAHHTCTLRPLQRGNVH